jgi:hypothetical protein
VKTVLVSGRLIQITATVVVASIRYAASTLGRDRLGYGPESFEAHFIRNGAAIKMQLGGCAAFAIMSIGHRTSAAFTEYIREQIVQFSEGVSHRLPPEVMRSINKFRIISRIYPHRICMCVSFEYSSTSSMKNISKGPESSVTDGGNRKDYPRQRYNKLSVKSYTAKVFLVIHPQYIKVTLEPISYLRIRSLVAVRRLNFKPQWVNPSVV